MEKPLLISGPLIDPVRKRQKTETRRLPGLEYVNREPNNFTFERMEVVEATWSWSAVFKSVSTGKEVKAKSPYGGKGTILWVRENWYVGKGYDDIRPVDIPKGNHVKRGYMADGDKPEWAGKTRPSIHMPRWLSRFELANLDTYPERLHDISTESVRREGLGRDIRQMWLFGKDAEGIRKVYRDAFKLVWIEINPYTWDANPWVWVVKFTLKTP